MNDGKNLMAVYTDVADDELRSFIALYDIGEVLSCKGIAEGVENSNFLVHTSRGYFILTLYERRVAERDRLDPVEPSAAFDALFAQANTAQYPEQYRYMAFRLAHAEGRTLAPIIYRDGGAETADLYARFSDWLAGKAS